MCDTDEKIRRIYVETSVISGMFDNNDHAERAEPFWNAVFNGTIHIVLSHVVDAEMKRLPQHVQNFYRTIPISRAERMLVAKKSNRLAALYVAAGIVGEKNLERIKNCFGVFCILRA